MCIRDSDNTLQVFYATEAVVGEVELFVQSVKLQMLPVRRTVGVGLMAFLELEEIRGRVLPAADQKFQGKGYFDHWESRFRLLLRSYPDPYFLSLAEKHPKVIHMPNW